MPTAFWPLSLTAIRLLLGPLMLRLSSRGTGGVAAWLVASLYLAIVSDIFDGILARHFGVSSPRLRRLDSQADLIFWLCALGSAWNLHPEVLRRNAALLAAMLALEGATYALSFARFGREHSTHAYSAKAWGIILVGTFTAVLGFGEATYAIPILFITYLVSFADVVAIILLLPRWECDVPSCYHAWLIRRGIPFRRFKLFH